MQRITEWAKDLREAMENQTPAEMPPEGGYPFPGAQNPQDGQDSIPELHADEEMNTCTLECELFRNILEHCGCNSAMADNIVQQCKLLGKNLGTLSQDNFDDIVGAAEYETPGGSPSVAGVTVMTAPTITTSSNQFATEGVQKEIEGEKFDVVKKVNEDEDELEEGSAKDSFEGGKPDERYSSKGKKGGASRMVGRGRGKPSKYGNKPKGSTLSDKRKGIKPKK